MNNWLIFTITAPALWGLTNVLDGSLRKLFVKDNFALTWIFALLKLPFVILFFIIAGVEIPNILTIIMMFIGGILWVIPGILYFKALETEEPSRIALLLQLLPIFTLFIAYFALNERLSYMQLIAFLFLIMGGALAALKKPEGKWRWSGAFLLIMLATFLWAASDVIFKKYEVEFNNFLSAFAVYFLGSFLLSVFWIINPKERKKIFPYFKKLPAKAWWMIIVSLIAGIGGSFLFAYALTLGKASLTSVIIGTQPLFTLLIGLMLAYFIKEIQKEKFSKTEIFLKGSSFIFILIGLALLAY